LAALATPLLAQWIWKGEPSLDATVAAFALLIQPVLLMALAGGIAA
jgi:hypothetical protein